jgi:predicted RNA-binding protein YlxR (DUF448 family)
VKNTGLRQCISCRKMFDRNDLIRITKNKDGNVMLWKTGHVEGRSAYLCKKEYCITKAKKEKRLEKILKISVSENFWKEIERGKQWQKNAQA